MKTIKKGDIVGRTSYGKDIIFVVEQILNSNSQYKIAILKGITIRITADSPVEDLEIIPPEQIRNYMNLLEQKLERRIKNYKKIYCQKQKESREKEIIYTGKILHIDGDKRYSEKSSKYYRKVGLNAIVRNVSERRQPQIIESLLQRYKPDILVITRS